MSSHLSSEQVEKIIKYRILPARKRDGYAFRKDIQTLAGYNHHRNPNPPPLHVLNIYFSEAEIEHFVKKLVAGEVSKDILPASKYFPDRN